MVHLAMACEQRYRPHMPKKSKPTDQYKRFVDAARELGTDESEEAFECVVRKVVKAPDKGKKAAKNTGTGE